MNTSFRVKGQAFVVSIPPFKNDLLLLMPILPQAYILCNGTIVHKAQLPVRPFSW
jgi:hypothetical protein